MPHTPTRRCWHRPKDDRCDTRGTGWAKALVSDDDCPSCNRLEFSLAVREVPENGFIRLPVQVVFSGEFGTTASDLCQHVDQYFEIGGLYTFKQSMSLFVNWTLDDREQLLA